MDDLTIWNIPFNNTEMRKMVWQLWYGSEPGLVAYWPFNEFAGTKTLEKSGYHDAEMVGNPKYYESLTKPLVTSNTCL